MPADSASPREPRGAGAALAVFASVLCGFLAIGVVLPVLPRYVHGPLGAGDLAVGFVTGAFAITAVIGRPIAGRLADARGRRMVVVAGLAFAALGGAVYLIPAGLPGLVAARLLLGVGDGWMFTAGAIWSVDLAPAERRGQAIGLFGLAVWGGLSAGPVIGEALLSAGGYDAVWVFAAASPLVGALIAHRAPDPHRPDPGHHERPPAPLLPRAVRRPGAALALANAGYGTVAGFVVLHLSHRGIGHGAAAFTAFASAVVVTRLAAGRLPDVLGPRVTALGAFAAETAGLALIGAAGSWWVAGAGAVVMGAGFALLFPSLALMAMTDTPDSQRGSAMGAFTAFFDVGFGLGAPVAGAVAALAGYPAAFWCAAAGAAIGGLLTVSLPAARPLRGALASEGPPGL